MFLNEQKYSECQLVTAINAAVFLGEPPIDPQSHEYERLVDMVGARHGSAIDIGKAYRYLRLDSEFVESSFGNLRIALSVDKLPVELSVWTEKHGFHSVLAIQHKNIAETEWYRVLNLREPYTDKYCWIEEVALNSLIIRDKNMGECKGRFRVVKLHSFYDKKKDPGYKWERDSLGKFKNKPDCQFPGMNLKTQMAQGVQ